jgi:hypothetical protein
MHGVKGLIIAVVLGILGVILNIAYLVDKTSKDEMVDFIGIKEGASVKRGEKLKPDDVAKISIPLKHAGNLKTLGIPFDQYNTIKSEPALRNLSSNQFVVRDDFIPVRDAQRPGPNEKLIGVPVDTRSFVASLLSPGDRVIFKPMQTSDPTPARRPGDDSPSVDLSKPLGPFVVYSIGNRTSSYETWTAGRKQQTQDSTLVIRIDDKPENAELERRLQAVLQMPNYRPMGVDLCSPEQ